MPTSGDNTSPLTVTQYDVEDKNLLLRHLRKSADRIMSLGNRLSSVEQRDLKPPITDIRDGLSASGAAPLNVTGLLGVLAQPQPASASIYSAAPTGQILQQLRNQQLVLVGSTSTGFSLNYVVGGNPNTLYQLTAGLSTASVASTSTNLMTLDTIQTATAQKMFSASTAGFPVVVSGSGGSQGFKVVTTDTNASFATIQANNGAVETRLQSNLTLGFVGTITTQDFSVVGNNTTALTAKTDGTVSVTKTFSSYNGNATAGNGVGAIVARSTGSALAVTTSATLFTPSAAGEYRVSWFLYTNTTGTGNITPGFSWTSENGSHSVGDVSGFNLLTLTSTGSVGIGHNIIHAATSGAISFTATYGTSTVSPIGTFNYIALLERLS